MNRLYLKKLALRFTACSVMGLSIAVVAVAGGVIGPNPTSDPIPVGDCTGNGSGGPDGAILEKKCRSGCALDPGCCQRWKIQRWATQGGGIFYITWCAGTAYECNDDGDRCLDAAGKPALPADFETAS